MCAGVARSLKDIKMASFLYIACFFSCLLMPSLSSPTGISPKMSSALHREDKNELRAVFNLSGVLSLQPYKNITQSSSVTFPISGFVSLIISPGEALHLRRSIEDFYDEPIQERELIFRKDYTLDKKKQGWFKFHHVPEKWDDARERCELEGAELASPLNTEMYKVMLDLMDNVNSIYTGIHSIFSYGNYYSIKGVPLREMPVSWSYTLSSDTDKRCVTLLSDGSITNVKCYFTLPYVCYKDRNDYSPLTKCGTADTKYTFNKLLNTCYKLHTEKKIWSDAFKTCSAEGGYLVIINDDVEMATVVQMFGKDADVSQDTEYSVHIGIVLRQYPYQWDTIHGASLESSGYSTWSSTNFNTDQTFGALRRTGLVAVQQYVPLPFVCEKKPDSLITLDQLNSIINPPIDI